jgi:hypothetical protein
MTAVFAMLAYLRAFVMARDRLGMEAIAPRQQLVVYKRKQPRPKLNRFDRLFWVVVRQSGRTGLNHSFSLSRKQWLPGIAPGAACSGGGDPRAATGAAEDSRSGTLGGQRASRTARPCYSAKRISSSAAWARIRCLLSSRTDSRWPGQEHSCQKGSRNPPTRSQSPHLYAAIGRLHHRYSCPEAA